MFKIHYIVQSVMTALFFSASRYSKKASLDKSLDCTIPRIFRKTRMHLRLAPARFMSTHNVVEAMHCVVDHRGSFCFTPATFPPR